MDTPEGMPPKVRITPQLIEEWEHDAKVLLDANCRAAEVIADLREQGCTPLMARQIVQRASSGVRTKHRLYGLFAVACGSVMALVGWWLLSTTSSWHVHNLKGQGAVALDIVTGIGMVLLGAWKTLSGSAVDVETTLLGTADSDLDGGR